MINRLSAIIFVNSVICLLILWIFPKSLLFILFPLICLALLLFDYSYYKREIDKFCQRIISKIDKKKANVVLQSAFILIFIVLVLAQYNVLFFSKISPVAMFILLASLFTFYFSLNKGEKLIKERKGGKWIDALFALILFLALFLRFVDIGSQNVGVDSVLHIKAAKDILNSLDTSYTRGALYTYLLAAFQNIFGETIVSAIAFNALLNAGGLVLFYLFVKKFFNRYVAIISVLLLSVSPFAIWMSYFVRLYTAYQISFFLTMYFVYKCFVEMEYSKKRIWNYLVLLVLLFISYHLHKSFLSAAIPVLAYLIYGTILQGGASARKHKFKDFIFSNKLLITSVFLSIVAIPFFDYLYSYFAPFLKFNFTPIPNSPRNYFTFLLNQFPSNLTVFFTALTFGYSVWFAKKQPILLFFLTIFFFQAFEYVYMINRFFSPRYIFHLLPFLVLLVSIGIFLFCKMIFDVSKRKSITFVCVILVLLAIIPFNDLKLVYSWSKVGDNPILEITYPYEETISRIDIKADDYLLQLNRGIWEVFQSKSQNVVNLSRTTESLTGEPKEDNLNRFFSTLREGKKGYLLSDIYRQRNWACDVNAMPPCLLRSFVDEAFVLVDLKDGLEDQEDNNLILYSWKVLFPELIISNDSDLEGFEGQIFHKFSRFFDLRNPSAVKYDSDNKSLAIPFEIRAMKGVKGDFLVVHGTLVSKGGGSVPLQPRLLFIPEITQENSLYRYVLNYDLNDVKNATFQQGDSKINFDLVYYQVNKQMRFHLTKEGATLTAKIES